MIVIFISSLHWYEATAPVRDLLGEELGKGANETCAGEQPV